MLNGRGRKLQNNERRLFTDGLPGLMDRLKPLIRQSQSSKRHSTRPQAGDGRLQAQCPRTTSSRAGRAKARAQQTVSLFLLAAEQARGRYVGQHVCVYKRCRTCYAHRTNSRTHELRSYIGHSLGNLTTQDRPGHASLVCNHEPARLNVGDQQRKLLLQDTLHCLAACNACTLTVFMCTKKFIHRNIF